MDKIAREKLFHNKAFSGRFRTSTEKYYSIAQCSRNHYMTLIGRHGAGKEVLEYGCGPGSSAFMLAQRGATVQGIDISDVAIDRARRLEGEKRLGVRFTVMNAEELSFSESSFDLVCGSGILHHLQLQKAYAELARTLRPHGQAIFLEPLGHNPAINLYRKRTPHLRSEDEHPLLEKDLELAETYFHKVETAFFHLSSLGAVLLRDTPLFQGALNLLDFVDQRLFRVLPFTQKYAWAVVMVLKDPVKGVQGVPRHYRGRPL